MHVAHILKYDGIIVQRVGGQINADQVALLVQTLQRTPRFGLRHFRRSDFHHVHIPEKWILHGILVGLVARAVTCQLVDKAFPFGIHAEILFAGDAVETIESPRKHQAFQVIPFHGSARHTLNEVENVLIRSVGFPFFHDGVHSRIAQALDGPQAETDVSVYVHTELPATDVDVRSQGIDTDTFALAHQLCDVGNVRQTSAHYGRHILGGEIGF